MRDQDLLSFGCFVRDLQPPTFPIARSDALEWWTASRDAYAPSAQRIGDLVVRALLLYEGDAIAEAADALDVAADASEEIGWHVVGHASMLECRASAAWLHHRASEIRSGGEGEKR